MIKILHKSMGVIIQKKTNKQVFFFYSWQPCKISFLKSSWKKEKIDMQHLYAIFNIKEVENAILYF